MTSKLHLVDTATGEAQHHQSATDGLSVVELTELLERKERDLNGYRLRLGAKEKELERVQGTAPGADDVNEVGSYWATRVVEEGWWSRTPAFRPGHPRWSAVAARLSEPDYDVYYCVQVVEGALMQSKARTKREWIDASSIFKAGNLEGHFERANDLHLENVQVARQIPDALRPLLNSPTLGWLCERCDCGHLRLEHAKADPARDGWQACLTASCGCFDFDDTDQRANEWMAQQRRVA